MGGRYDLLVTQYEHRGFSRLDAVHHALRHSGLPRKERRRFEKALDAAIVSRYARGPATVG